MHFMLTLNKIMLGYRSHGIGETERKIVDMNRKLKPPTIRLIVAICTLIFVMLCLFVSMIKSGDLIKENVQFLLRTGGILILLFIFLFVVDYLIMTMRQRKKQDVDRTL